MPAEPPQQIDIPLSWVGYDEVPIAYANQFLIQFQPEHGFVLATGQATAPPLIGEPEEIAALVQQIEFIPVRTLSRVAVTEAKLRELIAMLEANLRKFDQARSQIDPRTQ